MYTISKEVVRKNSEINFIVDIPSVLGKLRYFVKFKSKKSINEKDLEKALKESEKKGLPLLFLSEGSLTKKAEKYLHSNQSGKFIFNSLIRLS